MNRHQLSGFTLVEILVAIAIFAVISAIAFTGLRSAIRTNDHLKPRYETLQTLRGAFQILASDIQQMAPRSIRDELGSPQAALVGASDTTFLKLTRYAPDAPLLGARTALKRVEYEYREGELVRRLWPNLDRVQGETGQEQILLRDVETAAVRFYGDDWLPYWPAAGSALANNDLPRGVELELVFSDGRSVRRLFLTASSL
ncbi:MAG: type II secretion system minor pseudopilin GspJ [Pseudomonadota bacterium]